MLNLYPDSCGGNLTNLVKLLNKSEMKDVFSALYLLPSLFQSDLDRGFSVISYDIDKEMGTDKDIQDLHDLGYRLKLDFVLNHLSVQSPQFKDLLKNGEQSRYREFFIDWNKFWEGEGVEGPNGCITPKREWLDQLFMRKPGLPVLELPFPDGSKHFFWNTFYQKVEEDKSGQRSYLGQMDLNSNSELVWEFYEDTFNKLKSYGSEIVRLDAFAYLHKEIGQSNFFNVPGTWDILKRLEGLAEARGLTLLPEIHSRYEEGLHKELADKGYPIYDFFFPGLIIHAIETRDIEPLIRWINEIRDNDYQTVNMLGCHDGIPLLDMQGLLNINQIENLINLLKERGGRVKDLYGPDGKKISYYQLNATFYSALGERDSKMLLARAVQLFMPGISQVWYLDLFAGSNDYEAADSDGHKEINRTNLSLEELDSSFDRNVVKEQLELIRLKNNHPAFSERAQFGFNTPESGILSMDWKTGDHWAHLIADFNTLNYFIESS